MLFKDPLRLVLRQAALELAAAVHARVSRCTKLGHVRAIKAGAVDAFGGVQKWLQQPDRIQDLESARLDSGGTGLAVRPRFPLDQPRFHAVTRNSAAAKIPEGPAPIINTSSRVTGSMSEGVKLRLVEWLKPTALRTIVLASRPGRRVQLVRSVAAPAPSSAAPCPAAAPPVSSALPAADQHHQLLAARDAGVQQVPLQHHDSAACAAGSPPRDTPTPATLWIVSA